MTARQDDSYGEIGDSGSPSFLPVDGVLTVSGIHSAIQQLSAPGAGTRVTTYDSFLLHYVDQINDHLANTGHQLTMAPVSTGRLEISGIERAGNEVVISVRNPSGIPYDVHRATDLAGEWELVATSRTGNTWTGEIPPEAARVFWKLVHYPLSAR